MRALVLALLLTVAPLGADAASRGGSIAAEPGPAGPAGPAGKDGQSITGPAGPQGAVGPAGSAGPQGVAGTNGTNGKDGSAGPQGVAGPQGPAGVAGAKGDTGATGAIGPKASTFVCNATIADTAVIALSSGIRSITGIACTGVLATDVLEVYPTAPSTFPANYAVHHALPTAANTFKAVISAPALTLGASNSIPVAVYRVN